MIIGAGAFGAALGKILTDNGYGVTYFDRKNELSLEEAAAEAEAIVLAIPSVAMAELASSLPDRLRELPVILAAKGLLDLGIFVNFARFSVLSGPAFAEDIMAELPVTFTVTDELAVKLFANERVAVELTDDALGVVLCGSLKNIYAIGAGVEVEAQVEAPQYLEAALAEMKSYLANHGANPETADLACGIGDLAMSVTDEKSRNLRFGKALRAGVGTEEALRELGTVEGLTTLRQVDREGYPIITRIYELTRVHEAE